MYWDALPMHALFKQPKLMLRKKPKRAT